MTSAAPSHGRMTYRQRRQAKADRLREWADRREERAAATIEHLDSQPYAHDIAFLTQPGRIPARDAYFNSKQRAFDSLNKAQAMDARADGIQAQLDRAIYSDDTDAVQRLTERIEALEAARDRIKRYNDSCRIAAKSGGMGDASILDDAQRADLLSCAKYAAFQMRPGGGFPAYVMSNLAGNIARNRQRLAELRNA